MYYDSLVHEGKHSTEVKNTGIEVKLFWGLKPILLASNWVVVHAQA